MNLTEYFPTAEAVEAAPVASLASYILQHRLARNPEGAGDFYISNLLTEFANAYTFRTWEVKRAFAEAIGWLQAQGLICPAVDFRGENYILTRSGIVAGRRKDLSAWAADRDLPTTLLHPAISACSLGQFHEGRYDTAVFEAFKALEVKIRETAQLPFSEIGVPLARKAFKPQTGPLTDVNAEAGEQQALMDLMAGALGSYKNPHSHRNVELGAAEARDMLVMASHLFRITEARASS